jgi:uncharacterized Zn-binding protein involved in type VI secretion
MGKPAARVTDPHVCPASTGPTPHLGGPLLPPCCLNVLIGGLPAARITDLHTCVGPPAPVITGSTSVNIGGKPAARVDDPTGHGGSIVSGCLTVLIGP